MKARSLLSLCAILASLMGARASVAAAPREITIVGLRIHAGDVLPGIEQSASGLDLGPSPTAGASRVITRSDIAAAFGAHNVTAPSNLPEAVRVVRKTRRLLSSEVNALVRGGIAAKPMHHGVSVSAVREEKPIDVAEGWTHVEVDVPRPPKKSGVFATAVMVSFLGSDDELIAKVPVPTDFEVSTEGVGFDTPRGAPLTLLIQKNLIEIRVSAVATADGDVGDPVPVQIGMSGRVLKARLLSKDEAVALEMPR